MAEHKNIGRVSLIGLAGGIELVEDRKARRNFDPSQRIGQKVCSAALEEGLLIRPLSDVIVIMPPLISEADKLRWMCGVIHKAIRKVLGD